MIRTFLPLAVVNGLALVGTVMLGSLAKLLGDEAGVCWMLHFWLGLFGALGVILLHCLIFTYFLGTGRWVKEVKLAYNLPDEPLPRLTRDLKRRTFPPALFAMLVPIAALAAGMGAQLHDWPWPIHAGLAGLTLVVNGWAFVVEYRNVRINGGIIDQVMVEVDRIRAEMGLPSNEEAWRQQHSA